jgi:murein DD-endopeptidase MepM/ murein hydrolase activator NlpD
VSIRRPDRRERVGRLVRRAVHLVLALVLAGGLACATYSSGFYHEVQRGENLYRIGRRYGLEPRQIAKANGIRDPGSLRAGQQIWIPKRRGEPRGEAREAPVSSHPSFVQKGDGTTGRASSTSSTGSKKGAQREASRAGQLSFGWPVRGAKLTSNFGRRSGRPHEGVDLAARRGTRISAAESGRVIHSGRLGDYGKVVILKHAGNYRSVYAHANKVFVRKGQFVEKGQRIAEVGQTGRATGPHLHFEIRKRQSPRDPMLYLP